MLFLNPEYGRLFSHPITFWMPPPPAYSPSRNLLSNFAPFAFEAVAFAFHYPPSPTLYPLFSCQAPNTPPKPTTPSLQSRSTPKKVGVVTPCHSLSLKNGQHLPRHPIGCPVHAVSSQERERTMLFLNSTALPAFLLLTTCSLFSIIHTQKQAFAHMLQSFSPYRPYPALWNQSCDIKGGWGWGPVGRSLSEWGPGWGYVISPS
jgi:hypothetical protein